MSDKDEIIDDGLTDEERAALAEEDTAIEQPSGTADPENACSAGSQSADA